MQLLSKKIKRKKKVFLSAPIHHHFEAMGWPETKVTMRFWVLGTNLWCSRATRSYSWRPHYIMRPQQTRRRNPAEVTSKVNPIGRRHRPDYIFCMLCMVIPLAIGLRLSIRLVQP